MKMFEKILALNPTHYYTLKEIGFLLMDKRMYQEAIVYFEKAIHSSSESVSDNLQGHIKECQQLLQN